MNDHRFDEIARLLASPMPRRQVFRRILGGLAAATLATIGTPFQAHAQPNCSSDADCGSTEFCCNGYVCCATETACCGLAGNSICCPANQVCCGGVHTPTVCCAIGDVCSNNQCKANVSPH